MARHRFADAIEPEQIGGDIADALAGALLGARPLRAAELAERGYGVAHADVARDAIELISRDVEPVGTRVVDQQIFTRDAVALDLRQPFEAANAVLLVNDEIAGMQLRQEGGGRYRAPLFATPL